MPRSFTSLQALIVCAFFGLTADPARAAETPPDLTALSLEQLMNVNVTSVSKKSQKVSESAAAVHVITSEDIRRSGATSIPELLRNVPGLNVARIDSSKWAISARGFNGLFSNKLLVLKDGRSLYTPIFSGVFWDVQNTFLDDIERIEVIRGPGGTIWGRKCRQRGDQHHYQERGQNKRHTPHRASRYRRTRQLCRSTWIFPKRSLKYPRLRKTHKARQQPPPQRASRVR